MNNLKKLQKLKVSQQRKLVFHIEPVCLNPDPCRQIAMSEGASALVGTNLEIKILVDVFAFDLL